MGPQVAVDVNVWISRIMEDRCRPTCAWDANTANTADGYNRFYTCDKAGAAR